jgi:hypothetical protein
MEIPGFQLISHSSLPQSLKNHSQNYSQLLYLKNLLHKLHHKGPSIFPQLSFMTPLSIARMKATPHIPPPTASLLKIQTK